MTTLAVAGLIPCGLWFALGFAIALIGMGKDARDPGSGIPWLTIGGGMCFSALAGYVIIMWNAT